jgi:hypothetical protein
MSATDNLPMSGKLAQGLRIALYVVMGLVALPVALVIWLAASFGWYSIKNETCKRADPVRVQLANTVYAVPARLKPGFSALSSDSEIRQIHKSGRSAYCTGSRRPVPQRGVHFSEPAKNIPYDWDGEFVTALEPVRVFDIDAAAAGLGPVPSARPEPSQPQMFGRRMSHRCWEGYYGPGLTCRYEGRLPDGSRISVQVHPKPPDADRDRALKAVEAMVRRMQR